VFPEDFMSSLRRVAIVLISVLALTSAGLCQLAQIYIANENQSNLELLKFGPTQLTTLYNIGAKPDDMTINSAGQLLYTVPNLGTVQMFDPHTGIDSVVASGILYARDLAIEPTGQTMLVAKYTSPAEIIRLNLTTGAQSILVGKAAKLGTCDGIAYDGYGNLYAVANQNTIVQLNPTTGAIIATLVLETHSGVNGADGLTWDPFTQSLWATHDGKNLGTGLLQIFVKESGFLSTTSSGFTFYPLPGITNVDGIKSDGLGNLYVAAIYNALVYNISTHTVTQNVVVKGADGIALVPGSY
jgi:hypothetical protein